MLRCCCDATAEACSRSISAASSSFIRSAPSSVVEKNGVPKSRRKPVPGSQVSSPFTSAAAARSSSTPSNGWSFDAAATAPCSMLSAHSSRPSHRVSNSMIVAASSSSESRAASFAATRCGSAAGQASPRHACPFVVAGHASASATSARARIIGTTPRAHSRQPAKRVPPGAPLRKQRAAYAKQITAQQERVSRAVEAARPPARPPGRRPVGWLFVRTRAARGGRGRSHAASTQRKKLRVLLVRISPLPLVAVFMPTISLHSHSISAASCGLFG